MRRIYLDHAATTPLLPEAKAAMDAWLSGSPGNASSLHFEGRAAKQALDAARETLSETLGCLFAEIVFTSGGTEAVNLALLGVALANPDPKRNRVLLSAAEHHCALHTEPILRRLGYRVELLPVGPTTRLAPETLRQALGDDVLLVSAMHANNELGTWQPVPALAVLAHEAGALLHCDAVQSFLTPLPDGSLWDTQTLDADLVSVSAHKIGGPQGVGALFVRAGVKLSPLAVGGGQERELRAGTEAGAAIAGFAAAVQALRPRQAELAERKAAAREAFLSALNVPEYVPTVPETEPTLPSHLHLRLPGLDAETALIRLDRLGVGASSGAACSSGSLEPSHVLLAAGYDAQAAREGLRFTFGADTSPQDAAEAADRLGQAVEGIWRSRFR